MRIDRLCQAAFILGLLALTSCGPQPAEQPLAGVNGLEWEDRELERFSGECDTTDAPCGRFAAEYPEFTSAPAPGVLESLNEAVDVLLTDGRPVPLATMASEFIAAYRTARQEFPGAASTQRWEEEKVARVLYHDDRHVSLLLEEYSYTGGAHPNSRRIYGTWSLADGGRLALADLLKPGFEGPLAEVGEAVFREARGISANEALEERGFTFPDGDFALPDNFAVTGDGLLFFYNSYEIAPYALGPTEVEISFEELGELVR